jgi:hypothetical protein
MTMGGSMTDRIEMSIDDMLDGFAIWLADARKRLALSDEDVNTLCATAGMLFRHSLRSGFDGFDYPNQTERIAKELLERCGEPSSPDRRGNQSPESVHGGPFSRASPENQCSRQPPFPCEPGCEP